MTRTAIQQAYGQTHRRSPLRRLGPGGRMLAGYVAFFTVALLIFDAMILLSLLP
jgi:hypothetical protein